MLDPREVRLFDCRHTAICGDREMNGVNKTFKVLRAWYLGLCALPPVAFAGVLLWMRSQQGWGGWAAANALAPVIALSAIMALLGSTLVLWGKYLGERLTYLLLGTLLSGSVAGLFLAYLSFR